MYTIKEAAARTGLTVPVLRAWERRYGVVAPTRTAGGYRVYDEAALARLRSMRRLVDDGWSPSAAAAAIIAGTNPPAGIQTDSTAEEKRGSARRAVRRCRRGPRQPADRGRPRRDVRRRDLRASDGRPRDPVAPCPRRRLGGGPRARRGRARREQRGSSSSRGLVPGIRARTRPGPTSARRDAARGAPRAGRAHLRDGACVGPGSRWSTSGRIFRWTTGSRPSNGQTRGPS